MALTSRASRRAAHLPRRRGHHGRRRLPDDGRARSCSTARCRCSSTSTLRDRATSTSRQLEAALLAAHEGGHARAHARQPVRRRRGDGVLRAARAVAHRGQLRRARLDATTADAPARSATSATSQLLPAAPHDDGRGRRGLHERREARTRSCSRCATGAATACARPAWTTRAASASRGSSATLPFGYDHKYVYSEFGYNLKATDIQAAIGVAQLKKLPGFVEARRRNFALLHELLQPVADVLDAAARRPPAASRAGSASS